MRQLLHYLAKEIKKKWMKSFRFCSGLQRTLNTYLLNTYQCPRLVPTQEAPSTTTLWQLRQIQTNAPALISTENQQKSLTNKLPALRTHVPVIKYISQIINTHITDARAWIADASKGFPHCCDWLYHICTIFVLRTCFFSLDFLVRFDDKVLKNYFESIWIYWSANGRGK